jgi:hypothetical protein
MPIPLSLPEKKNMFASLTNYRTKEALRKAKYCRLQRIMRQLKQAGVDAIYNNSEILVFGDGGGGVYFCNRIVESDNPFTADMVIYCGTAQFSGDTLEQGFQYLIDNNKVKADVVPQ